MLFGLIRRYPFMTGGMLFGAAVGAGALTDSRIDPAEWHPPDPPAMTGILEPQYELTSSDTVVRVDGPEDVAFDDVGRLYTGSEDGHIYRTTDPVDSKTTNAPIESVAFIDGRPLALEFHDSDLLVCAIGAGLLSVDIENGESTRLVSEAGGRDVVFADDLHVTDNGIVYFSDATAHDLFQDELFELQDTGRLLSHDLRTEETNVELEGLGFANGVAPGPEGESLLINETSRYRVTRYWIGGERAGTANPFAENLVGYPDNIDVAEGESYWVAVPSIRDDTLERLHRHPWIKRQLGKLPKTVLAQVTGDPYGLVIRLDADGEIVESLHDPTGGVFGVTSATPHEGGLYLGTLFGDSVTRHSLN